MFQRIESKKYFLYFFRIVNFLFFVTLLDTGVRVNIDQTLKETGFKIQIARTC